MSRSAHGEDDGDGDGEAAAYLVAVLLGHPVERVRGDSRPFARFSRYSKGLAEQAPLYGNEIEFCFGDFYTRGGLTALVHCVPYIGFPRAVAAIRAVKSL